MATSNNEFPDWVDPDIRIEYEGQDIEFLRDQEEGFTEFFAHGWHDPEYDDLRERWEPLLHADEGLTRTEAARQVLYGKVALWSVVRLRTMSAGKPFKIDRSNISG